MKWKTALYDTLSLVILDAFIQRDPGVEGRMPSILAIEESFMPCHMRGETAERMRPRTEVLKLPGPLIVSGLLHAASLPVTIAEIDALVFAAAVHYEMAVVTGDERFQEVLRGSRVAANHIASFLHEPARPKSRTR